MPVSVKKTKLWIRQVANQPGHLAKTLAPLADAGADLQIVMGYRYHGTDKAAVEVYPVSGASAIKAAREAGLTASPVPTLLVEGDNEPGLGHAIAQALGDAEVNLDFLVAQVIGRKYAALIGFEDDADARKASALIKKVARTRAGKKSAKRVRR